MCKRITKDYRDSNKIKELHDVKLKSRIMLEIICQIDTTFVFFTNNISRFDNFWRTRKNNSPVRIVEIFDVSIPDVAGN